MNILSHINEIRTLITTWKKQGLSTAFVPTMGNLHPGHLQLVSKAKELADKVIVSIFVNPLQFGPSEDFAHYPRTLEKDSEQLAALNVDLLFTPEVSEIYPESLEQQTKVIVPKISEELCGASRPGHFNGVATIVTKLFNIVQPNYAIFGQKDFQQLIIIKKLVQDLCFPIKIISIPITRETDGLAMSSRNGYLTQEERKLAPQIYQTLTSLATQIQGGNRNYEKLSKDAMQELQQKGFKPDYISIRNTKNLALAQNSDSAIIILAAAYLGKTRLIDNLMMKCSVD